MKKLLIASSLLICFSLGTMAQGKHKKHHHGKKHHHHMSKKGNSSSDKTTKTDKTDK